MKKLYRTHIRKIANSTDGINFILQEGYTTSNIEDKDLHYFPNDLVFIYTGIRENTEYIFIASFDKEYLLCFVKGLTLGTDLNNRWEEIRNNTGFKNIDNYQNPGE